jgi:hypothetical protein
MPPRAAVTAHAADFEHGDPGPGLRSDGGLDAGNAVRSRMRVRAAGDAADQKQEKSETGDGRTRA